MRNHIKIPALNSNGIEFVYYSHPIESSGFKKSMDMSPIASWLDQKLPSHDRLTQAVVTITENLLRSKGIDFLAVTGRTKNKQSALDKVQRKGYKDHVNELTDLSGIRIIVYFESNVEAVSNLINESFCVDKEKSLNKDELLSTNQIGYRSVHFVCDLGTKRAELPEFEGLSNLKFEFQIRTVLQHAWAELAHDRNYKFSGKLPREIERQLYLYAGMLEIADKGFDDLSRKIDGYIKSVHDKTTKGDLDTEINSISLAQFIEEWSRSNGIELRRPWSKDNYSDLTEELREFGITKLSELNKIIPSTYAETVRERQFLTTIYGVVRDWMLITDWRRFLRDVHFNWVMADIHIFDAFMDQHEFHRFCESFEWEGNVADQNE